MNTKASPKKRTRNTVVVYPQPVPTKQFAESVIIRKWHAYTGYGEDRQITEYQGTRKDLIAVGIAPEQIFNDVGKSGTKRARILYDDGVRVIEIKRLANNVWNVERSHPTNAISYTSHKATCTEENGGISDYEKKQREREQQREEERNTPVPWNPVSFKERLASSARFIFGWMLDYPITENDPHRISDADRQALLELSEQTIHAIMQAKIEGRTDKNSLF